MTEIATLCTFPKLEQNYCLELHRVFHKPVSVFVNTNFSVSSGFQRNRDSTVSMNCVTKSRAPLSVKALGPDYLLLMVEHFFAYTIISERSKALQQLQLFVL